jgi:hypothetical protein
MWGASGSSPIGGNQNPLAEKEDVLPEPQVVVAEANAT